MTPQEILARYKAIPITLHPDPVPLRLDETNTLRVTGSRITLDILIEHHKEGWARSGSSRRSTRSSWVTSTRSWVTTTGTRPSWTSTSASGTSWLT